MKIADDDVTFAALGLDPRLLKALSGLGYEEPTPVQAQAIPTLVAGRDLLAQAATGTGKTAAFVLPLLQRMLVAAGGRKQGPFGLVLVPTRELALQVAEAAQRYGAALPAHVLAVYGGQPLGVQLRALQRGVDLVVATPGRALDHLRRGHLRLETLSVLVLDEADEMLDMGFAEDLEALLQALPATRQSALFSATLPARIASLAARHLRTPVELRIREKPETQADTAASVRQTAYLVSRAQKLGALVRVLDLEDPEAALVFCRTRHEVDELVERLGAQGRRAEALHGGVSQPQRERVLKRFREGRGDVLVATDVAARGLDIPRISHVVNYDVPSAPEAYVHRIGRTGRAGRAGTAITLVEPRERQQLKQFERLTKRRIDLATLPTVADLKARRLALTGAALRETLVAGGLEHFRVLVESLAAEFDPLDIAAAGLKLAHGDEPASSEAAGPQLAAAEPAPAERKHARAERKHAPTQRKHVSAPREQPPAAHKPLPAVRVPPPAAHKPVSAERKPETRRAAPAHGTKGYKPKLPAFKNPAPKAGAYAVRPPRAQAENALPSERLSIGMGRRDGLRPADLVGALTRGAGLPSRLIGAIELGDDTTVVEVLREAVEDCARYLRQNGLRGRPVVVKRAP